MYRTNTPGNARLTLTTSPSVQSLRIVVADADTGVVTLTTSVEPPAHLGHAWLDLVLTADTYHFGVTAFADLDEEWPVAFDEAVAVVISGETTGLGLTVTQPCR